jgi:LPS-assembly protein
MIMTNIKMKIMSSITALFFLIAVMPIYAMAIEGRLFDKDKPIEVTGDNVTYDRASQVYHATGDVVVIQGGITLTADTVTVDMNSGTAKASGSVEMIGNDGDFLRGETLDIDMNKDTAIAITARLFYKEANVHLWGDSVKRTGTDTYEAKRAFITTCDCEDAEKPNEPPSSTPAWSFYSTSSKVKKEGFFTAWNSVLYLKNIPVLYTPFIAIPVKTKRQSGLLVPRIGFSDLRGTIFNNSLFWAISENQDATFYLDIEDKRGLGKGLEYRYVRTAKSFGELYAYHFGEDDIDRVREYRADELNLLRPMSAKSDRWEFRATHREYMDKGFSIKADIHIVSDDEYFLDNDLNHTDTSKLMRTRESLESTVSITKSWDRHNLSIQARKFDNLLLKNDDPVLQVMPEVRFTSTSRSVFGTPLFYSMDSTYVNYERDTGVEGQRLNIRPTFSIPTRPGGLFEFTPSFTPWFTAYGNESSAMDSSNGRLLYEINADLTTTFVRNFELRAGEGGDGAMDRVAHTIRPKLSYTYIPAVKQSRLPSYDGLDRIMPVNKLRYSINSTITGRSVDSGKRHEYLYFDIGQSYDIREERGKEDVLPGKERPYGDVDGELIVRPAKWLTFNAKGSYDLYKDEFENYDAAMRFKDERGDSLSVKHRFVRDGVKYSEASANLQITRSIAVDYTERYSYDTDDSFERSAGLVYRHQCYGFRLSYLEREDDEVLMLTFSLKGLGEVFKSKKGFAN